MNVLVLNGSPKNEKSNTMKITNAFLDGINSIKNNDIDIVHINKHNIEHCTGCYSCWNRTPGECIFNDGMKELIEAYTKADLVIWSFPLYNFSMPSNIKSFLDRLLPINYPDIEVSTEGNLGHPERFDISNQKNILISTCGFPTKENNYEALVKQFDIYYEGNYTKILCPEGELFRDSDLSVKIDEPIDMDLSARVNEYLGYVKMSGAEYIQTGSFSKDTRNKLDELLFPTELFIKLANLSWDTAASAEQDISPEPESYSLEFINQMADLYNPKSYEEDIILEMYFTDLDESYQLKVQRDKCSVLTSDFEEYTTRIEAPFKVWKDVSDGKINGSQAIMDKKYKVKGDFETIFMIDTLFGDSEPVSEAKDNVRTSMSLMLLPFIALWIAIPINIFYGGIAAILVSALALALSFKYKITMYDKLSILSVILLGIMGILSFNQIFLVCLSYLLFGVLWLGSCFTKIPLTAHYSSYDYGGEEAFDNPLFMKINKILTKSWGIVYIIASITSYFLLNSSMSSYTGLINKIIPLLMGIFTAWFQRWYPKSLVS